MPENLASILTDLVDENSSRARPLPLASVTARGRTRQRRQRFTALASSVVVCAVAAGAGVSISGASSSTGPADRATLPPVTKTPSANRVFPSAGPDMFLAGTELPASKAFNWALSPAPGPTDDDKLPFPVCGTGSAAGPVTSVHAKKAQTNQYWSPNTSSDGSETIYEYPSAAAARSDYTSLVPNPALCAQHPLPGAQAGSTAGHQTAAITDGYAWVQTGSIPGGPLLAHTQHVMVALAGNKIAFFAYTETDTGITKYDTAGDADALQRMANRLADPSSIPGPAVAPPPSSAFLNASRIPFPPTAGGGKGWVPLALQPTSAGKAAPTTLCGADFTNIVGGVDSTGVTHGFTTHAGTTGEAVANASETIHAYPNAGAAAAAFGQAQKIAATSGCHATINGSTYNYSVVAGATTSGGFSIQIVNDPDESVHEYIVVKGTNVAQLNIQYFNHYSSDTSSTDEQVFGALAAALP